jgi:hypothetical protein
MDLLAINPRQLDNHRILKFSSKETILDAKDL